ncbi:hypothetical protein E5329_05925 [Petralouisia muris]|uniref:Uncharacterized protein n=1 Tax=Petralouisia muris TaxID=3032872 RepID=A0AC61S069_9FIRM|nr:zinc dependent phospholipase C family protein [Petralouisia muris]TGY97208.1 hypothetical protein E5329_05925 [Petralouisia muris]
MPGFTTHYLFGLNAYKKLNATHLKSIIQKEHHAYSLGLQGPDLFFYFLPSYAVHKNNIGSIAHTEKTKEFLRHLLASRGMFSTRKEQDIAEAYAAGFLGHYILDTRCHPYVYWKTEFTEKTNQYHGRHMGLETEIDAKLLKFYRHLPPYAFQQNVTIGLSRLQKRTITRILHYVYARTYPELGILPITIRTSISSIQLGTKFLHDPSGYKKKIISTLEKLFLGHTLLSTLIPSGSLSVHRDPLNLLHEEWKNPWDHSLSSTASFFDLMKAAQTSYLEILEELNRLLSVKHEAPVKDRALLKQRYSVTSAAQSGENGWQKFLNRLGNLSYHSGLDAGIPS